MLTSMKTVLDYYRHARSLGAFRAVDALALAREAVALDQARYTPKPPTAVCWEDGVVRLSFTILVF